MPAGAGRPRNARSRRDTRGARPFGSVDVYDESDVLIGEWLAVPASGSPFVGVQSNVPIGWIEFDEDAGGDDIYIEDFRFDCDGLP